jgi:hypothetical protein
MGSCPMSKKSPFKQLKSKDPTPDEHQAAWQEVYDAPPRSAIVLATTLIEGKLKELLLANLRPELDKDQPQDLFGMMKPLSSFSAKIRLGYGMRLYGERTYHDLDLLRELRNLFAHGPLPLGFDTPDIKAGIDRFHCHSRGEPDPRKRFTSIATWLISHLALKLKDPNQGVKGLD